MQAPPQFEVADLAQAMFAEASDALFLLDPESDRIVDINPSALRLTGIPRDELLSRLGSFLFRSETAGGDQRLCQATRKSGFFHSQEGYLLRSRAAGGWIPVNLSVSRLHVKPHAVALVTARDIREQRRTEAKLKKHEAEFKQLLASVSDCLWSAEIGAPGRWKYRYISPAVEKITGLPASYFQSGLERWEDLIHPEDRAHWQATRAALHVGQPIQAEYRLMRPDGNVRWIRENVTVTLRPESSGLRLDAVMTDVTDRQRTEDAVRASNALLQSLMEGITDPVFVKDRAGRYLMINVAGARRLGRPVEQIVGKDDRALNWSPETARQLRQDDELAMTTGQTRTFESISTANDVTVHYLTTKGPFRDHEGAIRGVIGIARDITPIKQAEEELRRSREWFQAVFQASRDGILVEEQEHIVYANEAFAQLFGYANSAEVAARPVADLLAPEDGPRMLEFGRRRLGGEAAPVAYSFRGRRKDGTLVDLEASVSTAVIGGKTFIIAVMRDLAERHRLEDQLRQAQKMEAVGRLAGGVAHDFNNLLTVITGYGELLLTEMPPPSSLRPPTQEILKAAEQAADLTSQLLAFGRKQMRALQVIDLNALVRDMEKMMRRLIGEDIDLATRLDPALGAVKADPGQIHQVILNLAVNARDAMPRGGKLTLETCNVELDEEYARKYLEVSAGTYVLLAVSDTGVGIGDDVRTHLFEPFFTTKEQGKGTGLGLSTVYGIVKQSGGHVAVYSEPGQGTTFKVYLPRLAGESRAIEVHPVLPEVARGNEVVLLVEDQDRVRTLTREVLQRNGYTVLEARNGRDGLRVAAAHAGPIHLVVTDVVMPEMNGRDLVDQLTAVRSGLKVLYLSGYTDNAVVRHGVLEAETAFLQKPFTPRALARKAREVLEQ